LDFSALASLPIADLAADDCTLFLWATDPLLPHAFELMQKWGFEYKTIGFYWVKLKAQPNTVVATPRLSRRSSRSAF
jgi:N6-adenosine-specific RNA methylase IME4